MNIIIIGARNYTINYDSNNYETWNNKLQADYSTLDYLRKQSNHNIICLDNEYQTDIEYFRKDNFVLGDVKYLDINAHNIIIEFANLLDENHVVNINNKQNEEVIKYKDYKISWVSCGCEWNQGFPLKTVELIIKNNYLTPIDTNDCKCYLNSIRMNKEFKEKGIAKIMKPFSIGIYRFLGSLIWRGFSEDYSSENVLRELFKDEANLIEFINKEKRWNRLSRDIRLHYSNLIYGSYIEI